MTKLKIEDVARAAHEANRSFCAGLGDHSQPTWDMAPDWMRSSVIAGVRYLIANPGAGPDALHQNWVADKKADGWKYGPVKDPVKKEHPNMVPFHALSREDQFKDLLFGAVVRTLLPLTGQD